MSENKTPSIESRIERYYEVLARAASPATDMDVQDADEALREVFNAATRLQAEKAELHTALLQAREDALEEAAKVCVQLEEQWNGEWRSYRERNAHECSTAIRALKFARQAEEGEKG